MAVWRRRFIGRNRRFVAQKLVRSPSKGNVTFGTLFIDDEFECLTLEDEIRERPGVAVSDWKVPRQTAIPAGSYRVSLTMSARFGRVLPLLENVPGFTGIRIHTGKVVDDTEGCILVGRRTSGRMIAESRAAFRKVMATLKDAAARGDTIAIEIRNPGPASAIALSSLTNADGRLAYLSSVLGIRIVGRGQRDASTITPNINQRWAAQWRQ